MNVNLSKNQFFESWKSFKNVFSEQAQKEAQKSLSNRLQEKIHSLPSLLKGFAKGSVELCQSAFLPTALPLRKNLENLQNPKILHQEYRQLLKLAWENPRRLIRETEYQVGSHLLEEAKNFVGATSAEQAEKVGVFAPWILMGTTKFLGSSYEQMGKKLSQKVLAREFPLGFKDQKQFEGLGKQVLEHLENRGIRDAEVYIRGSSVSGLSYSKQVPFDIGRISDLDLSIVSRSLLKDLRKKGVDMFQPGRRSAPLGLEKSHPILNLKKSGMWNFTEQLTREMNRPVTFMIYKDQKVFLNKKGVYLAFPHKT